jgi:hypothetical protein
MFFFRSAYRFSIRSSAPPAWGRRRLIRLPWRLMAITIAAKLGQYRQGDRPGRRARSREIKLG